MNAMKYKGYIGSVEYTPEDGVLFGRIQGITPVFSYEAEDIKGLNQEFENAVNDYLELCEEQGWEPEKPEVQTIKYEPDPASYQKAVSYAEEHDLSVKAVLDKALEEFLKQVA